MTTAPENLRLISCQTNDLRLWTKVSIDLLEYIEKKPAISLYEPDVLIQYSAEQDAFYISRPIVGHINSKTYQVSDLNMVSFDRNEIDLSPESDFSDIAKKILKKGDFLRLTFLSSSIKIFHDKAV